MLVLADLVYAVAAVFYLPVALYQAFVVGKNRTGWSQRFGRLPELGPSPRRVWVHAVSLGEINATPRLIASLTTQSPDMSVVVSTTTDTGYRRAVELYGASRVFRFPLDFSRVMRKAFEQIRPALIVLVELEVWPNLVREAARRNIPIVVVNGRLTQRSARRLSWFGAPMRRAFSRLAWVGAQDEAIAARFRAVGVDPQRITVTGSVKWDTALVTDRVAGDTELAHALGLDHTFPTLVCGSTGPQEEEILLDAYQRVREQVEETRCPRLILVPRKPERFREVAGLIASRGFPCVRRSQYSDDSKPARLEGRSVILGDTMGELRKFYALADLVFIGRSLVPMGGSDPMEAAALAKPMLMGPHVDNFRQPASALAASGALIVIQHNDELVARLVEFVRSPDEWKERGLLGREVVLASQGATDKSVRHILEILACERFGVPVQDSVFDLGASAPRHYTTLAPASSERS